MSENHQNQEEKLTPEQLSQSLNDLKALRQMVQANDEVPILAYWGFLAWGGVIIVGSLIHFLLVQRDSGFSHGIILWVPLFFVGILFETLAWFRNLKMTQSAVTARGRVKFYVSACGLMCSAGIVLYYLLQSTGLPVPGLLVVMFSILVFYMAQYSFFTLFIEGGVTLLGGFFIAVMGGTSPVSYLVAGLFCGVIFISCGIRTRLKERHIYG